MERTLVWVVQDQIGSRNGCGLVRIGLLERVGRLDEYSQEQKEGYSQHTFPFIFLRIFRHYIIGEVDGKFISIGPEP